MQIYELKFLITSYQGNESLPDNSFHRVEFLEQVRVI